MTYTPEQLREKDAWIETYVFNNPNTWVIIKRNKFYRPEAKGYTFDYSEAWKVSYEIAKQHESICGQEDDVIIRDTGSKLYTTDAAASDVLDDKILEKCPYEMWFVRNIKIYRMESIGPEGVIVSEHPDKKICRVLFCEKLWGKDSK